MPPGTRHFFLLLALCAAAFRPAAAQQTHAELLGRMVGDCLIPAVASTDSFRVSFEGAPAFMQTMLLNRWLDEGRTVLADDVSAPQRDDAAGARAADENELDISGGPSLLLASLDEAGVTLERSGGGMLDRTASVAVRYRLTASSGQVLSADTCRSSEQDRFEGDRAEALAFDGFAGTSPDIPTTSRLRRIVEPVVVIGAAAIGTYLFFNLRSRRSDN